MKAIGHYKPLPIDDDLSRVDIDLPVPTLEPRDILLVQLFRLELGAAQ